MSYYKKFVTEDSKHIQIDDNHSCTEEQLRVFIRFLFHNFKDMSTLHNIHHKRKTHLGTEINEDEARMGFFFDQAIDREFNIQKAELNDALHRNISEFMNDTLQE